MRGVFKRHLSLAFVGGFQLESAGRKRIHHADRDKPAVIRAVLVGVVSNNPNVRKIST